MLKVIYSGQMRALINNGSLSLAPLGLLVIICTLAACVHCLLINHCPTHSEGRGEDDYCVVYLDDPGVVSTAEAAAVVGSPVSHLR